MKLARPRIKFATLAMLALLGGIFTNIAFAQNNETEPLPTSEVPEDQIDTNSTSIDNNSTISENNSTEIQDVVVYRPGIYKKARTQFDGVTNEQLVSYLRLDGLVGVSMDLPAAAKLTQRFDFTVMMWFKIGSGEHQEHSLMYLFSLGESLSCYLSGSNQVMCDSSERCQKLAVETDELVEERWFHLTISGNSEGGYMLLEDHFKVLGEDHNPGFVALQSTREWSGCIGNCADEYVFQGGVREFSLFNKYATPEQAKRAKDHLLAFDDELLAYYRFADIENTFLKDAFRGTEVDIMHPPSDMNDLIGYDIIPNDICPSITNQKSFAFLDNKTKVNVFKLADNLKQSQYEYTVTMTIRVNETSCTESNPFQAAKSCNLVLVDDVFMLYFEGQNKARFHFFALKKYYETQSGSFFVPQDQWITIQLAMSQYDGYHIVISDQNGRILRSFGKRRNMQMMRPDKRMMLFTNFEGSVDKFNFCTERLSLPVTNEDLEAVNCPVKLEFSSDGIEGTQVVNFGSDLNPSLTGTPDFIYMPYEEVDVGQKVEGGHLSSQISLFDGIACNDDHKTIYLPTAFSTFTFNSPALNDFLQEATLEFWFKPTESTTNTQQLAKAEGKNGFKGLEVFIDRNGQLICAPFSRDHGFEPYVIFEKYSDAFADESGWFHISCGYSYRGTIIGTLSNSMFEEVQEFPIANEVSFIPRHSMTFTIGGTDGMFIKEVRLWSVLRNQYQIFKWKLMQLDPEVFPPKQLLNYFRLASGTMSPIDMAELAIFVEQQDEEYFEYDEDDSERRLQEDDIVEDVSLTNLTSTDDNSTVIDEEQEFIDHRTPADQKLNNAEIVSEFSAIEEKYVDRETGLLETMTRVVYHTVCPLYTYPQDGYCYRDPVNRARITIYPNWDEDAEELIWDVSLFDSSLIRQELLDYPSQLVPYFGTQNDQILNLALQDNVYEFSTSISPQYLRDQGLYNIEALISNEQRTFSAYDTVKFTPVQCRWFEVENNDASNAYYYSQESQGVNNITFALELHYNPNVTCPDTMFYDKLSDLEFTDFILGNTYEYIHDKPQLEWFVWSPDTENQTQGSNITNSTDTQPKVFVNVTIPTLEQFKFPLLQDVKILMAMKWTNTEFEQQLANDDMIFQNVMYTIHFAPSDNELIAQLTVNREEAIRGDNVMLDASGSYVSNLPSNLRQKGLVYSWICPEEFTAICDGQAQSILAIPFANFQLADGAQFQTPYEFSVVVTWTQVDGTITAKRLTKVVTWYDISYPVFSISYTEPILVTQGDRSNFTMVPDNFSEDDLPMFNIEWILVPDVQDERKRVVSDSGTVFTVTNEALEFDTEYQVFCRMTYKSLEKVYTERSVTFNTRAPPSGGVITVTPDAGFVGDQFTVKLDEWVSANPPILYDVYGTLNVDGTQRGPKYTINGQMRSSQQYTFTANSVYPIQIEITDSSMESVVRIYDLNVTVKVEDVEVDNSTDTTNGTDSATDDDDRDVNPARLLMVAMNAVPREQVATRASYMREAIKRLNGVEMDQAFASEDAETQKEFRKDLLNAIGQGITVFQDESETPDTKPISFLSDSTAILAGILEEAQFLDKDMVIKAKQQLTDLKNIDNDSFENALTTVNSFRENYLVTLEGARRFARYTTENNNDRRLMTDDFENAINQWIEQETTMVADSFCADSSIAAYHTYEGTEISISLSKMNSQSVDRHVALRAFDASYELNSGDFYNMYSQTTLSGSKSADLGNICAQLIAYKANQAEEVALFAQYSESQADVYVYVVDTDERVELNQVFDTIRTSFSINPYTYQSNQTICMAFSEQSKTWSQDACQQVLKTKAYSIECTCNSFNSEFIGLFLDESRMLGEPIPMPEYEISYDGSSGKAKIMNDSEIATGVTFNFGIEGYMTMIILILLYALIGQFVVIKADRDDQKAMEKQVTMNDKLFIECVSKVTNESVDVLMYRRAQLAACRGPGIKKPVFARLFAELHPIISPFACYDAQLSRYTRFSTYLIQMNVVALFCIQYFQMAEMNSQKHDEALIDGSDMANIMMIAAISGFALLPFISVPLNNLFKSSFVQKRQNERSNAMKMAPKEKPMWAKVLLHATSNILTLTVIAFIVQVMLKESTSQSIQFCIMSSYLIGMSFGLLITNILRIVFNAALRRKTNYLVSWKTIQVMGDIEAVRAAELTLDTTIDKMNSKDVIKNEVFNSSSNLNQVKPPTEDQQHSNSHLSHTKQQQSVRSDMDIMNKPVNAVIETVVSDNQGFQDMQHDKHMISASPKNVLQKKSEARYSHVQVNEDLASV